jgi:hypothetical protein
MNRYMIICRLRWPALLLLTGVIALLDQADILSWGRAWPLYLILLGVLALAERATLAAQPPPPADYPYAAGYPIRGHATLRRLRYGTPAILPSGPRCSPRLLRLTTGTSIVPAHDLEVRDRAKSLARAGKRRDANGQHASTTSRKSSRPSPGPPPPAAALWRALRRQSARLLALSERAEQGRLARSARCLAGAARYRCAPRTGPRVCPRSLGRSF